MTSYKLTAIEPGTYCLMVWNGGCSECARWGHTCSRDDDHGGRHRCFCGATRRVRSDDPRWDGIVRPE